MLAIIKESVLKTLKKDNRAILNTVKYMKLIVKIT